jgi:hypothetical protein
MRPATEQSLVSTDLALERILAEPFGIEAVQRKARSRQEMRLAVGAPFDVPPAQHRLRPDELALTVDLGKMPLSGTSRGRPCCLAPSEPGP